MSFKPKRIAIDTAEEPARPSSAQIAATIGPLTGSLIPTQPPAAHPAEPAPARAKAEPTLMMSFKASRSFARTLAQAAEPEGGLRRLIARVFAEAGYPVPEVDLKDARKRRTYD